MADSDTNFWTGPARAPYRLLAGCTGALMLLGAVMFLRSGVQDGSWRMLAWVPICLFNAGGSFGLARTGRW